MFNILKYKIKLPSLFTFLAKLGMEFPNDPRPACFVAELYSIRSIDLNSNSCGLQLTMYTGSKQRAQRMGRLILTSYYKTKTIHPLAPHLFQLKTPLHLSNKYAPSWMHPLLTLIWQQTSWLGAHGTMHLWVWTRSQPRILWALSYLPQFFTKLNGP